MLSLKGSQTPIDFVMYIGDENENEEVFQYLNSLNQGKHNSNVDHEAIMYTCAIGMKMTQANYFISTPESVSTILEQLSQKASVVRT